MKLKWLVINIVGLFAAVAVLGGSFIYAASNIDQVKAVPSMPVSVSFDDDFYQNGEVGIGDLMFTSSEYAAAISSDEDSSDISSEELSTNPASSKPASSEPASSKPASSEPASSNPASSKPASSEPASSNPASSEPASSELVSSETLPPSSEPSSEISSDASSEEVSSEDDISSEEEVIPPAGNEDEVLLDILAGAVQREIVGTNTPPNASYYEAYKAQAVACHSYMQFHKERTGSYPKMSYSKPNAKTVELVRSVLNEVMYYDGAVVNASYHAASGGHTQSASYVWSGNAPYLQAAVSGYDDYDSTCVISVSELESRLANAGIAVSGDPSAWFDLSAATYTDGGFVDKIVVGESVITGRALRESIIGGSSLKSCKILDISVSGDSFVFTTKGYGHGAGMSQLGALGYAANEGWSYQQILTHYYTGVEII